MKDYREFLQTKQKKIIESGFEVDEHRLNKMLYDFQRFTTKNNE